MENPYENEVPKLEPYTEEIKTGSTFFGVRVGKVKINLSVMEVIKILNSIQLNLNVQTQLRSFSVDVRKLAINLSVMDHIRN